MQAITVVYLVIVRLLSPQVGFGCSRDILDSGSVDLDLSPLRFTL